MDNGATCSLCAVYEHDMDVLFMQGVLSDNGFLSLFLNKTDWCDKNLKAIHAELSNTELNLGETDITVILDDGLDKYALLIEDKIDAIAQPEQHQRYVKRGDKAVKNGVYKDYKVFIICPEKYYRSNDEAKKYEHYVSYEECAEYFRGKADVMSDLRYQEIMQALEKAKRPSNVTIVDAANAFFKQYCEYQREHFPALDIRTKETSNGYWVDYRTSFPYESIVLVHKMPNGCVDLTFDKSREKLPILENICEWLNAHGLPELCAQPAGKSTVLRINVPKLYYRTGFDKIPKEDIDKCFEAIVKLTDVAKFLKNIQAFLDECFT